MVPTTDKHCFLNLPETATSLIKVPDTFSASRESAYERFNEILQEMEFGKEAILR